MLQILHARGGELTAGQLAARFSHAWPTTTRHLKVLIDADLITVRRLGRERLYQLNRAALSATLDLWLGSVALGVIER